MSHKPLLPVVAAVVRHLDGRIGIAQRPLHKHQGGLWEFPGGKIAAGESPQQALARELEEELGINGGHYRPLMRLEHHYPDLSVQLDVWQVSQFNGHAHGKEGQAFQWVWPHQLNQYAFPEANWPILKAMATPPLQAITGHAENPQDWQARLQHTLAQGVHSLQLRSSSLPPQWLLEQLPITAQLCQAAGVHLILNSRLAPLPQLLQYPSQGLHLRAEHWQGLQQRPLPSHQWLSLACHSAACLERAKPLAANVLMVSPVLPTRSHPGSPTLGWQGLSQLCALSPAPLVALGGLSPHQLPRVLAAGAQGLAALSAFWPEDGAPA